ncbi:helix-turn-helix domain-containing protein [Saccharopolyspora sp. NPDC049426]|uniref:helix-turn-helix domain-containing protein n=1 Tax=Saccharopolyspora sp. NPDC049426 TaxID=3155652 RepID=UPI0034322176
MKIRYKFRSYPTPGQQAALARTFNSRNTPVAGTRITAVFGGLITAVIRVHECGAVGLSGCGRRLRGCGLLGWCRCCACCRSGGR